MPVGEQGFCPIQFAHLLSIPCSFFYCHCNEVLLTVMNYGKFYSELWQV